MYQNREPRFYVNVFWSGMTWHGANKKTANVQFYFQRQFGSGKIAQLSADGLSGA